MLRQFYCIKQFQMWKRGTGVKESQNFVDITNESPLFPLGVPETLLHAALSMGFSGTGREGVAGGDINLGSGCKVGDLS